MQQHKKPDWALNARQRWDRKHMGTISTKLSRKQREQFDKICRDARITRYEAMRRFCMATIYHPETLTRLQWKAPRRKAK